MRRIIFLLFAAALTWACSPATLTADDTPSIGATAPGDIAGPPNAQGQPPVQPPGQEPGQEPGVDPEPEAPPPPPPLSIVIDQPPRGHRQAPGPIQVTGRVVNGPTQTLTVDGQAVQADAQGNFSVQVDAGSPGLLPLITEATTADGRTAEDRRAVLLGADADPAQEVTRAMQIMITTEGITRLNDLLGGFIGGLDIDSLIGGQDTGDFQLTSVTYDEVTMRLVPRAGFMEVRLTIHELRIGLEGEFEIVFVPVGVSGDMRTEALYIDAEMHITPTPEGSMDMALRNPRIQFEGFGFNIDNVPGFIEDLFEGTVRGMAEDAISEALQDQVLPELFDPESLSQEIDVLGRTVQMGMKIRGVDISYDGLMLTMGSTATALDPVHQGGTLPIDMAPAQMSFADPIDLAMSADMIGRILHSMWAAGALDLEMAPGGAIDLPAAAGLPLFIGSLGEAANGIDPSSPLTIRVRSLLPPVVYVDEGEKPLVIEIGDMLLDLEVPEGRLATVAVHTIMRVSLNIDTSTGELAFVPEIEAEAWGDVADMPRGQVKTEQLERQIALAIKLLPAAIASETFSLGADALPVPFLLENARFEADAAAPWVHIRSDILVGDGAAPADPGAPVQ